MLARVKRRTVTEVAYARRFYEDGPLPSRVVREPVEDEEMDLSVQNWVDSDDDF